LRRTPYTVFFKPLLDRLAAFVLLVVLSPLMLFAAALVWFTSRGPALFRQRRVGRGGREFTMLKFRTMSVHAPPDVPTHKLKGAEGHITPVGRFLRKTSLDELPQLFNILMGDMSFVGPRPALRNQRDLLAEREKYGADALTPGITGWAQVHGRDELSVAEKAEKDGYYASHAGVALDAKIVIMTLFNVLLMRGIVEGETDGEDAGE
jgi:O-antigen biosynthesis protein WbqP